VIYRASRAEEQLHQGEIVSNVIQTHPIVTTLGNANPDFAEIVHPLAVVLTQDCDLESDFLRRSGARDTGSQILSILFCEAVEAAAVRQSVKASKIWDRVRSNKDERYQYLRAVQPEADAAQEGTPEIALDFKRYFTVPTDEVYVRLEIRELKRRACLESPYREHLATRFFYYHYRIALPQEHYLPPGPT